MRDEKERNAYRHVEQEFVLLFDVVAVVAILFFVCFVSIVVLVLSEQDHHL